MNLLVIDDEKNIRSSLALFLRGRGYQVTAVGTLEEGRDAFVRQRPDAVILDVYLDGMNGLELLDEFLAGGSAVPVVVISGGADVRTAVDAVRRGAYDFLEKPLDTDRLETILRNALAGRSLVRKLDSLTETWREEHLVLGGSRAMREALALADKAAPTPLSVLIQGPSGSGKEVFARYIHVASRQAAGPFVAVNCAAIPAELFESELFGSVRGAFTGAQADRPGYFQAAADGTLFLDEIGELPLELQPKLLRAVEQGEFRRVGASREEKTNARIVCATNRDLAGQCRKGHFREDLYYRLGQVVIQLPSLSQRPEDIPGLVNFFLQDCDRRRGLSGRRFSESLMDTLRNRSWPGNVRELRNQIERCAFFSDDAVLDSLDGGLPVAGLGLAANLSGDTAATLTDSSQVLAGLQALFDPGAGMVSLKEAKLAFERLYVTAVLERCGWSVKEAAARLDLLPNNLSRELGRLGIQRG